MFDDELQLRIGITSGEVVVGRAREQSSFVTGDIVNVAARLEQAAEPGDILVAERAASLVAGAFEFAPPLRVEAKGKPGGVECRKLLRALSLMRPRGLPGLPPAFVGRDDELARLRDEFAQTVADRRPRLVMVIGEAGIGKTRLMREMWAALGQEAPDALRRTGRCPSYGHARAYGPVAEILREQFGIGEGDSPERVQELLGDRTILGLALGLDVASELHPIVARDRLHDAWVRLVDDLASAAPLVMLVEDLHWAEETLLELLERTLADVEGTLLLLATARPEFVDRRPTWGRGRLPTAWLWLEALASGQVERLVEQLTSEPISQQVSEVLDRAEGNPLFLEELLAMLTESDSNAAVPDSLRALIASRIDHLETLEKGALQTAAVVGRAFRPSSVRDLLGAAPDFHTLEQRDFVRRGPASSAEGERELVFKHALTREVAYGSLTRRDRAHLHADYAEWLEVRAEEREEAAAVLAHHYSEAVRGESVEIAWSDDAARLERLRERAVTWLRRAAELAAKRYDVTDALTLLARALELALEDGSRIEIHRQRARIESLRYNAESFRSSMEEALSLGPDAATAAEIYAQLAYYGLGRPYMWRDPPPRELAERWLASALELSKPGTSARAYATLAVALSDATRRIEAAEETLAIGRALDEPGLVASALQAKTFAATEAGNHEAACEYADEAIEAADALSDPGYRGFFYWSAGFAYLRAGRIAEVLGFAEACDRLSRSLNAHEEVHAIALHAQLESVLGRWDALGDLAEEAESAAAANADFECQFNWRNLLVCALARHRLGEETEARRLEAKAAATALVYGPIEREPALLRLALRRGDLGEAERILAALPAVEDPFGVDGPAARLDALAALGRPDSVETEASAFLERRSYTRPFAFRALGITRKDSSLLERAATEFESIGLGWRAEETRLLARR